MIRTRFAPSPTGVLHLGSVRTALFNWLYARHFRGSFILRVEDTDRERSTQENVEAILDGMRWLGLNYDEGPIFQTARYARYREVLDRWLDEGHAYRCYCKKEELQELRENQLKHKQRIRYDGRCRGSTRPRQGVEPVIRFKNPLDGQVVVEDLIRGRVIFDNQQLDDLIIARSDGTPTYNFTVVVDDCDMAITHVIRGDDHLNNTPRQMNMLAALGVEPPEYAHLPMILGQDGAKLSKRHGAVDIREYRDNGFLPQAMLNYLVRLGWSHGDQEVFSDEEMISSFDLSGVNQSASSFDPKKLLWINQQHIIDTPVKELGQRLEPFLERSGFDLTQGPAAELIAEGYHERADTLRTMAESARYCYEDIEIDPKLAKKFLRPIMSAALGRVRTGLESLDRWEPENIHAVIVGTADDLDMSMGKLGQPIRVAVTGGSVSPPLDVTLQLVGKERTLARLDRAIEDIEARRGSSEG